MEEHINQTPDVAESQLSLDKEAIERRAAGRLITEINLTLDYVATELRRFRNGDRDTVFHKDDKSWEHFMDLVKNGDKIKAFGAAPEPSAQTQESAPRNLADMAKRKSA